MTEENRKASERPVDRLARLIIAAIMIAIGCTVCWYFREALIYVIIAAVVSLIGNPIMSLLKKLKIKGRSAPPAILTIITQVFIFLIFSAIITQVVPVIYSIIETVSINMNSSTLDTALRSFSNPLQDFNNWLISTFPSLGEGFRIEKYTFDYLVKSFDITSISSMIGSVASFVMDMGIGIFSVVFISFFFIRDDKLFINIIAAMVPDSFEQKAREAVADIQTLLSRYFVGLMVEVGAVALLNFIGLALIAKLGVGPSLGIAFMAGMLNVIPYVGPWIGAAIGTGLGLVLKFSAVLAAGGSLNFVVFTLILIAIFVGTQLIDNFLLQPYIYSTSIKASPLEIFIVLIIAGHLGGILGMLIAIPAYTVIRVIASKFFPNVKAIQRLTGEDGKQKEKDQKK